MKSFAVPNFAYVPCSAATPCDAIIRSLSDHFGIEASRQKPDGSLVAHVDLTGLANSAWNEIVVDSRGNAYVNNTGFDFPADTFGPGIVALVTLDGSVRAVADSPTAWS